MRAGLGWMVAHASLSVRFAVSGSFLASLLEIPLMASALVRVGTARRLYVLSPTGGAPLPHGGPGSVLAMPARSCDVQRFCHQEGGGRRTVFDRRGGSDRQELRVRHCTDFTGLCRLRVQYLLESVLF